jgi:hypothetical protein
MPPSVAATFSVRVDRVVVLELVTVAVLVATSFISPPRRGDFFMWYAAAGAGSHLFD